ncbi:MAG: hypothetical protein HKM05_06870 [Spirochaetales bacterium]|nr:hypothetical protein [Spirochaetales bacterium]
MRLWETAFLLSLLVYHLALLAPRRRRAPAWNWLAPLAGLLALVSAVVEGLRWTDLPAWGLLILDILVLMFTFKTLNGKAQRKGFWFGLRATLRYLFVVASLITVLAIISLSFWFPLPANSWSGPFNTALRIETLPQPHSGPSAQNQVLIWYPAAGSYTPGIRPLQTRATWITLQEKGGPPPFLDSHWALLPAGQPPHFIQGGKLAGQESQYPVLLLIPPQKTFAWEYEYLAEDLASQGFVVAALTPPLSSFANKTVFQDFAAFIRSFAWSPTFWNSFWYLEQQQSQALNRNVVAEAGNLKTLLTKMDETPGNLLFHGLDLSKVALWNLGAPPLDASPLAAQGFKVLVTPCARRTSNMTILQVPYSGETFSPGSGPAVWSLKIRGLHPADLTDMAFLKPYLAFWNLKGRFDAHPQLLFRAYTGDFLMRAFYPTGRSFTEGLPLMDEVTVTHNFTAGSKSSQTKPSPSATAR